MSSPTLDEACALIERQKVKMEGLAAEVRRWRDEECAHRDLTIMEIEKAIQPYVDVSCGRTFANILAERIRAILDGTTEGQG